MELEPITPYEVKALENATLTEVTTEVYNAIKRYGLQQQTIFMAECSGYNINHLTIEQADEIGKRILLLHTVGKLNRWFLNPMQHKYFTTPSVE